MGRLPIAAVVAGAIVLAACATDDGVGTSSTATTAEPEASVRPTAAFPSGGDGEPFALENVPSSPGDVMVSGLAMHRDRVVPDGAPEPLVAFEEIRSGGPPPDGIPPIDEPRFLHVPDVDFLADDEPVLVLEIDGDARAYPVQIMTWHEIVNDTVGGVPVTVSYCPLCNSAVAYDRRLDDRILDFGTSGLLYNSALVMYDRQTETLWSHFTGEGIIGRFTGRELDVFPLATVAWSTFRDAEPDGVVLSRDTGFSRDYGRNPYPGYDDVDGVPFLFQGEVDGRYTALTRIVGVEHDGAAVGIPLQHLREQEVVSAAVGGRPLVAFWAAGTSSALESASIAEGVDVGATGVFVPEIARAPLTFVAAGGGIFTDTETGSSWNVLGEAVAGELAGERLDAYVHVDTFWFAWSTFRPDTEIVAG